MGHAGHVLLHGGSTPWPFLEASWQDLAQAKGEKRHALTWPRILHGICLILRVSVADLRTSSSFLVWSDSCFSLDSKSEQPITEEATHMLRRGELRDSPMQLGLVSRALCSKLSQVCKDVQSVNRTELSETNPCRLAADGVEHC